jgi:hypothetical protein
MKRIRYGAGVVGIAPALGLIVPAVHPTPAPAHQAKPEKTVSLRFAQPAANPALATCGGRSTSHTAISTPAGKFSETVIYSRTAGGGACISSVFDLLHHRQSHLEMRTRIYSKPGGMMGIPQTFTHGSFVSCSFFNSVCNTQFVYNGGPGHGLYDTKTNKPQVCTALVNSTTGDVKYGPICINLKN